MAERLASVGSTVLRLDYTGTGDAAGTAVEPGQWDAWRRDLVSAAAALRHLGCSRIALVGVRLGGLLALSVGGDVGADAVVAWEATRSGRRYIREFRLLGEAAPEIDGSEPSLSVAGSVLTSETIGALSGLGPSSIESRPAARVLLVERAAPATDPLVEALSALHAEVEIRVSGEGVAALDQPTEYATVPTEVVDTVVSWLDASTAALADEPVVPTLGPLPPLGRVAQFRWGDAEVMEDVVTLGDDHLVAVRCRPAGTTPRDGPTVVWLNTGSEHHVGPGRAWVEFARELATCGWTSLRVDFSGWGESPDASHAPGRPYDAHTVDEVTRLVAALRSGATDPPDDPAQANSVVLVGLCASAWVALAAAKKMTPPDGVVALNPQMYWQPGDPVEANLATETHVRRLPEIERWQRLGRLRVWDALDVIGFHHPAATWLRSLTEQQIPVLWLFAAGDDGLDFLDDRLGRPWRAAKRRPTTTVVRLDAIDHGMHRTWERLRVTSELTSWLERRWGGAPWPSNPSEDPARPRPLLEPVDDDEA